MSGSVLGTSFVSAMLVSFSPCAQITYFGKRRLLRRPDYLYRIKEKLFQIAYSKWEARSQPAALSGNPPISSISKRRLMSF
jgi:hypothetical protein